jgi:hypothetical protein
MRSALRGRAAGVMTSKMKETMGTRLLDAAALRKKCMRAVNRQRKSDYFCCMYGDAPKITSGRGKIQVSKQASSPALKPDRPAVRCNTGIKKRKTP